MSTRVAGVVLAAGAGSRFGAPKATVVDADGRSWLRGAVRSLLDGGCSPVVAVLGAGAEGAVGHLAGEDGVRTVVAIDWQDGVSASLRAGVEALTSMPEVAAVAITLVDVPDVGAEVMARLLAHPEVGPDALLRASYAGRPGHPVVIGRHHWQPLLVTLAGDRGAGPYLEASGAVEVECGDLASGRDVDVRPDPTASQRAATLGTNAGGGGTVDPAGIRV